MARVNCRGIVDNLNKFVVKAVILPFCYCIFQSLTADKVIVHVLPLLLATVTKLTVKNTTAVLVVIAVKRVFVLFLGGFVFPIFPGAII
jgi:hypothetical protein